MSGRKFANRRYSKFSTKKSKTKKGTMENEGAGSNLILHKFLKDVQDFMDKSKDSKECKKLEHKKQTKHKTLNVRRGLFENGLKSRPSLKGLLGLGNKARLKGNLNDLIRHCPGSSDNGNLSSSSSSQGSYVLEQIEDKNRDGLINAVEPESCERIQRSFFDTEMEMQGACKVNSNNRNNQKDQDNEIKQKSCLEDRINMDEIRRQSREQIDKQIEEIKRNINECILNNLMENIKKRPSILRELLPNDEIKKIAQIVVNEKVDKAQQTEDTINCEYDKVFPSENLTNNIQQFGLPFPPSPKQHSKFNDKQEGQGFFDFNPVKESNIDFNFIKTKDSKRSEENSKPIMLHPTTPPPTPLPLDAKCCWAPSILRSVSPPQKTKFLAPTPTPRLNCFFNWSPSPRNFPVGLKKPRVGEENVIQKSAILGHQKRWNQKSSLEFNFPKRKKITFSPHRL